MHTCCVRRSFLVARAFCWCLEVDERGSISSGQVAAVLGQAPPSELYESLQTFQSLESKIQAEFEVCTDTDMLKSAQSGMKAAKASLQDLLSRTQQSLKDAQAALNAVLKQRSIDSGSGAKKTTKAPAKAVAAGGAPTLHDLLSHVEAVGTPVPNGTVQELTSTRDASLPFIARGVSLSEESVQESLLFGVEFKSTDIRGKSGRAQRRMKPETTAGKEVISVLRPLVLLENADEAESKSWNVIDLGFFAYCQNHQSITADGQSNCQVLRFSVAGLRKVFCVDSKTLHKAVTSGVTNKTLGDATAEDFGSLPAARC